MDDGANESAGEHEPHASGSANIPSTPSAAASGDKPRQDGQLPVVWSPKLDSVDDAPEDFPPFDADEAMAAFVHDGTNDASGETSDTPAVEKPLPRSLRFALLAASIAAAAAVGSLAGSLSASGVAHLWSNVPASVSVAANAPPATKADLAELSALKADLDGAARAANAQFAKIADRLDHIERAQIEPGVKLAHIADAIDRLEKKGAAASAAPAPSGVPETTGSIAAAPPVVSIAQPDKVLPDWVVQDVRGGRALVESRYGAVFEVGPGSVLPGLGRVETIKRQDGQWIVVTARGLISSAP